MQSIHTSETNMTGVKVKLNAVRSGSTEVREVYACTSVAGKEFNVELSKSTEAK